MAYRWTFGNDPLNLEKFCERSTIKYDIIDYGVTMDPQKKSFIETGESHLLKNHIMESYYYAISIKFLMELFLYTASWRYKREYLCASIDILFYIILCIINTMKKH